MRALQLLSPRRRHLSWLLWLVLLVPLAQSAAAWHGYSHWVPQASADEGGAQLAHGLQCDLCLSAAAVGGGALPGAKPGLLVRDAVHESPRTTAAGIWLAPPTPAYLSRAPPTAPR